MKVRAESACFVRVLSQFGCGAGDDLEDDGVVPHGSTADQLLDQLGEPG
jgi:hypothetical protein